MPVTRDDVRDFNRFIDEKLSSDGAESLQELARQWEAARQREEVNEAIREGLGDIKTGRTEPFFESQDKFREERHLPPRP